MGGALLRLPSLQRQLAPAGDEVPRGAEAAWERSLTR